MLKLIKEVEEVRGKTKEEEEVNDTIPGDIWACLSQMENKDPKAKATWAKATFRKKEYKKKGVRPQSTTNN